MPDPSYVVDTQGKAEGLSFHLTTAFYPPLPDFVKKAFTEVFTEYWDGDIDSVAELESALSERAYYTGGVGSYNFWQFLNPKDLNDE